LARLVLEETSVRDLSGSSQIAEQPLREVAEAPALAVRVQRVEPG
jgi:hypothetical protein